MKMPGTILRRILAPRLEWPTTPRLLARQGAPPEQCQEDKDRKEVARQIQERTAKHEAHDAQYAEASHVTKAEIIHLQAYHKKVTTF